MRHLFTIALLCVTATVFGQVDSTSLKQAMANLDQAIINKDEKALNQLLNTDVSYGHSNGWVQKKSDVINDLKTGRLVYDKIENSSSAVVAINKTWATTRTNATANGKLNGNPFELKLHILQVWLKTKNGWELIARQSTKLQ